MKPAKIMMLVLAVASLVLGTGGVAFAKSSKAKAPIQKENEQCGNNVPGATVIGTATLKRTGNSVKVTYKLTGGLPTTEYAVSVWEPKPPGVSCIPNKLGTVGTFTTNKKGKGVGTGTIVVPAGVTHFFATGFAAGHYNDALAVTLP